MSMSDQTKFKSFLVIQTASIGDVILATPVIEKIHAVFPEARIDFLLKGEGDRPIYIEVPFSIFFSHRIKHTIREGNLHETERNLALLSPITKPGDFPIKLYPSAAHDARMSQFKTVKYITISPASLWFTKQYPTEKWIEFIKEIDPQIHIYFLGSQKDYDICDMIIQESGHTNSMNLAGKTSFLDTAVLMRDASMNYVNDSAPLHLASSVNAKTTAIFCSTVPRFGFGPQSDDAVVVETAEDLDCRPCGLHGFRECPKNHFKCALTIDNKELLKRIS